MADGKKVINIGRDEIKAFNEKIREAYKEPVQKHKPMTGPQKELQAAMLKKTEHKAALFLKTLESLGIPQPVKELMFHPTRKWRFDFAWPNHKIALEVEGGIWNDGGHTRGAGFTKDIAKYNQAGLLGWTVLRTNPDDLCSSETYDLLKTIIIKKQAND